VIELRAVDRPPITLFEIAALLLLVYLAQDGLNSFSEAHRTAASAESGAGALHGRKG
jgi:hypothetical protein